MIPHHFPHIFILAATVSLSACLGSAEHTNPLDPESDEFAEVGIISGTTTRFYPPYPVVEDAEVRLIPGNHVAVSDADGRFVLDDVPVGDYQLLAAKDGFASPVQQVRVELGRTLEGLEVRMDGLPIVRDVGVRSIRVSRWFPPDDLFLLEVEAQVEDADGLSDLQEVRLEIPDRTFISTLPETAVAGRFRATLPADSLPGRTLYGLLGEEMVVVAEDDAGFESTSGPHFVVRVIDYTPVALDPQGQENVSSPSPRLEWEDAALAYDYTYRVDVVRDQANVQTVVHTVEDIPAERTSYTLETQLPPGTYFWTVSVVDAHGNRSRSKEAGFIVPQ